MAELTQDLIARIEALEKTLGLHRGPQPGATSLNRPHTGVPYLDADGNILFADLPTGTAVDEVAIGNHIHSASIWGYYL